MHDMIMSILDWVAQLGYWGIMIGLMVEVIPSEIVLSYGGYLVSKQQISFEGAVLFGTIGGTIAQLFVYWIGRYGGRPFLEKYGKYILINKHHIDIAEKWFDRYGTGVIFTARFIPVVRHAISIPAGIARMPLGRFTLLTTLAVIPWSILFIALGKSLGENWENIDEVAGSYVQPAIYAAVALLVMYAAWKWYRGRQERAGKAEARAASEEQSAERELAKLGERYVVFNGVNVRAGGREQRFDYLAVGPNGLFHIESEVQDGQDPTSPLYRSEYALKELLRSEGINADTVGVLVAEEPDPRMRQSGSAFAVVSVKELARYIRERKAKHTLDSEAVQTIAALIRASTVAE